MNQCVHVHAQLSTRPPSSFASFDVRYRLLGVEYWYPRSPGFFDPTKLPAQAIAPVFLSSEARLVSAMVVVVLFLQLCRLVLLDASTLLYGNKDEDPTNEGGNEVKL